MIISAFDNLFMTSKTKVLTVPAWTQALHYDFSS
jgi:hypothetical protein